MNPIQPETTTVRDFLAAHPGAIRVLGAHGIDYCCGGGRSLRDACLRAGVEPEVLIRAVVEEAEAAAGREVERDWSGATCRELVHHVLDTHHRYTYEELDRLSALAEKVRHRHGGNYAYLVVLADRVADLRGELIPHMHREEVVLFPYFEALEAAFEAGLPAPFSPGGDLERPLAVMDRDHERVGDLLRQARAVASNYVPPEEACRSWRALYEGLEGLERDVHRHVHLENNVLFERARRLVKLLEASASRSLA